MEHDLDELRFSVIAFCAAELVNNGKNVLFAAKIKSMLPYTKKNWYFH